MGIAMGWQGTWEIAAAGGVSIGWDQENPIPNIPFLGVYVGSQKSEDSKESTSTPKQNTDRNRGGRPRGTNFDETDKKICKQIFIDWRDGTNTAKQRIGTIDKYLEMVNPLQALEKRTLRYLFGKYATKFGWTRVPCKTQVRLLIQAGKLSEVFV